LVGFFAFLLVNDIVPRRLAQFGFALAECGIAIAGILGLAEAANPVGGLICSIAAVNAGGYGASRLHCNSAQVAKICVH
jgi:hypothetical protein